MEVKKPEPLQPQMIKEPGPACSPILFFLLVLAVLCVSASLR